MANTIIVKRSSVPGKVPGSGDLQVGELAVNLADKKLYSKDSGGTVIQLGGGAGTGDVVGPNTSTDNAIARYDGVTGELIQNSTVTLDDNGTFDQVNGIVFDTTPTSAPTATGSIYWDSGDGTPAIVLDADVTLQLGQENVVKVYNGTGSTITNGKVVAVSGAQGQRPSVVLADADTEPLSSATLGITTESIADGAEGFVTTFGLVRGINTSAFTAGDPIWLSQTAGAFTATRPSAPANSVFLGWVLKVNASSGEVFVNISNGWELDELHNVLISSPASGNTLIYDATAGVWKNANLTAGTGISVTNGAGSISIANTGVTSVALTAPTGLTVSGSPVTTTGTLALTYTAGYSIPTTASQTNWDTAYTDRLKWDGGSTDLVAATGRTSLGATTVGSNFFTLTNPTAITFPRINADNSVSTLDAATFRTAIGAGTGNGTVTSVAALTLGTTGTDLSSSVATGTTTPVITLNVPTASATNRGALSSTDWSTFNGKQAAYTNLTSIGGLANAAGWLYNNGSGTFSYSTPTKTDVGLGNVTNDAQTKASIVPNTAPTAGQLHVGNAGGTAFGVVSMSGDATLASTGAITLSTVNSNVGSFTNASITVDAKGRITAASTGSGGSGVTSITAGNGLSGGTITTSGTISVSTTYQGIGTYMFAGNPTGTNPGVAAGTTVAGSSIAPAGVGGFSASATNGGINDGTYYFAGSSSTTNCQKGSTMSGTWQANGAGAIPVGSNYCAYTLYIRVA